MSWERRSAVLVTAWPKVEAGRVLDTDFPFLIFLQPKAVKAWVSGAGGYPALSFHVALRRMWP